MATRLIFNYPAFPTGGTYGAKTVVQEGAGFAIGDTTALAACSNSSCPTFNTEFTIPLDGTYVQV